MPHPITFPDPPPEPPVMSMYCPRCDRRFYAITKAKAEKLLADHVANQHPDHDPEWNDDE